MTLSARGIVTLGSAQIQALGGPGRHAPRLPAARANRPCAAHRLWDVARAAEDCTRGAPATRLPRSRSTGMADAGPPDAVSRSAVSDREIASLDGSAAASATRSGGASAIAEREPASVPRARNPTRASDRAAAGGARVSRRQSPVASSRIDLRSTSRLRSSPREIDRRIRLPSAPRCRAWARSSTCARPRARREADHGARTGFPVEHAVELHLEIFSGDRRRRA